MTASSHALTPSARAARSGLVRSAAVLALPLVLLAALTVGCTPLKKAVPYDFDGDGRADRVSFAMDTGLWVGLEPSHPLSWQGQAGDVPVPGDYDGDGRYDIVVVRGSDWIRSNGTLVAHLPPPTVNTFGLPEGFARPHALPVPGDYDGDGRTEPAWFQEDNGTWTFADGSTTVLGHGPTDTTGCCLVNLDADIPVPADYDGDGRTDLAVFNPVTGRWLIRNNSTDGSTRTVTLLANPLADVQAFAAPADYDGVGHAQPAELTPSGFIIEGHTDKVQVVSTATTFELPASADFDGIGHVTPSYVDWQTDEWIIAGRWRVAGIEPVTFPTVSLAAQPLTYPWALLATLARTTYADHIYADCNSGHVTDTSTCLVPS